MGMVFPWFLLGLAGVALPIWLHRFARQTDQKRPFASLMFLEASTIRRSRRHELRYWLLLAARVLLLILLALAFAGPLWKSLMPPGVAGATLHVVVVDTSMSMQEGGTWERASERASALIRGVKGSDRVMLVAADHRMRVLHEPVFASDVGAVQAQLSGLKPGVSRLDYGTLMSATGAWSAGPGEQVVMHLVTDMQQSASPLRFADLRPPPGMRLDLVDVGEAEASNLRVADVREIEREPGTMLVRVEGDAKAVAGRTLVLEINGKEHSRTALKRDATLPLSERFVVGELGLGEHRLAARLEPADSLPQDDARFALLRRVQPKVLVIAATPDGDDARYLLAALQSLESPRFDAEAALPSALGTRQLNGFAAIVVSDAGLLNQKAADELKKYVEAGGAALLTLGERAAQLSRMPVSGAKLARGKSNETAGNEPLRVAEMQQSHAMLRETGAWRRIRFFRHVPVEAPEGAQVLMRFENGAPLMIEQVMGQGKLLVFASPMDRQWNDLAIHPLFVRFVAEATAYLSNTRGDAAAATVGTSMNAELLRDGGGQVFDPQGKRALMLGGQGGAQWVPDMAGFYELRGGGRSDYIAVNVDPRESRLVRWDAEARQRWLDLQEVDRTAANAGQGVSAPNERVFPLWFWLLFGAALLAFLEPLLANYYLNVRRERIA
jgi:hypothetical protein